ncbi:FMN-dependent L-lactate dehydrogenase LldD [Oecophyllibacter saccharovorans]|uniref:FMN-dependent L-lactate dehydrogenase LldD n=1 Tax=Oecophyllibacter saccharovorans TaxID=2558360 RepID=UPI00116A00EE|nr:FMN-dependent L-lactate dehydrogenase LldD [Oecophyllibacter saccharovorans]TPW34653.1 alpha-hydroxy-acid oxidizing protein [Oecophyllibacter saccharovorans]
MIISSARDYREAARRRLPPFLFHYIDGGAGDEETMRHNQTDLRNLALRQRVLQGVGDIDLSVSLLDQTFSMPIGLGPVGLAGMYARRGEVQAARAAEGQGVPFTLSSVSVCPIEEVQRACPKPIWFQLYVLRDRAFMKNVLERAWAVGIRTLIFTVDMPLPGSRYRDAHSGMSGPYAPIRRIVQAMVHPRWALDVGIFGRPHDLGNVSTYFGKKTKLEDYVGWLAKNFDPSISWKDLQWIRDFWKGSMVIKGILDPDDARDAVRFGADGIVVSNHGGRQLDGALSTAKALPVIADAVKGELAILVDSGIRTGLDVVRVLAAGADMALLGRAWVYALGAAGGKGVTHLLELMRREMEVTMTLIGVSNIASITPACLARLDKE